MSFLTAVEVKPTEVQRLAKLPQAKLVAALTQVIEAAGKRPNYSPVVDGIILTGGPWQPDAHAASAGVPMVIGTTRIKTTALLGGTRPHPCRFWPSPPTAAFASKPGRRRIARPRRRGAPVWLCELDWATPVDGGSPRSLDLAFVFDNVAKSEAMIGFGHQVQLLADQMSPAWIAFARSGSPQNSLLPAWPAYSAAEHATMVFNIRSRVALDYRGDERSVLAALPLIAVTQ